MVVPSLIMAVSSALAPVALPVPGLAGPMGLPASSGFAAGSALTGSMLSQVALAVPEKYEISRSAVHSVGIKKNLDSAGPAARDPVNPEISVLLKKLSRQFASSPQLLLASGSFQYFSESTGELSPAVLLAQGWHNGHSRYNGRWHTSHRPPGKTSLTSSDQIRACRAGGSGLEIVGYLRKDTSMNPAARATISGASAPAICRGRGAMTACRLWDCANETRPGLGSIAVDRSSQETGASFRFCSQVLTRRYASDNVVVVIRHSVIPVPGSLRE